MRMVAPSLRILLVDDEPTVLRTLKRGLVTKRPGWSVLAVTGSEDAGRLLASEAFDVVLSDYEMPVLNGIELLKLVKRHQPTALRVILSGISRGQATNVPPGLLHGWLSKLYSVEELIRQCEDLLVKRDQRKSRARAG